MKRRIIVFYLLSNVFIANLFSENILKIPKANRVSIKTVNTVEYNEENAKKYTEKDYPRISKNKIVVNLINFFDANENLLFSSDKMEINFIQKNRDSNVFLCLQYDDKLKNEKKNKLYLFDFTKGQKQLIDVDVSTALLSSDGKKVYYVTDFKYPENTNIKFTVFENKKRKTQSITYKDYIDEICDGVRIKQESEGVSLYIYQDSNVIVKLFIDSDCKVTNHVLSQYDEALDLCYLINPDGSKEYLRN